MWFLAIFLLLTLVLPGFAQKKPSQFTCVSCHPYELDEKHKLPCTRCHQGKSPAQNQKEAHQGLIRHPASPENYQKTCGTCHPKEIKKLSQSPHLTLKNMINGVLTAFGLKPVSSITELPSPQKIKTKADLVIDLLRRRCLRCHLYYQGDDYEETKRGLGCAACHLYFAQGEMKTHEFLKTPPDRLCLHCHYANKVGFDYYGMFEHDYPYQFRSPLIDGELPPRPWGVEFHEMSKDVHLKNGMPCMACHTGEELMAGGKRPSCLSCHKLSEKDYYHRREVLAKARCSACHARFSFQDEGTYLMLQEDPDWDDWIEFYVQGSSEIEKLIATYYLKGEAKALMLDKISGKLRPGVWFKGFDSRRFEEIPLGFDENGKVSVMRPVLDLHLSYVDAYDEVVFDDLTPDKTKVYRAYSPHTIGRADYFRTQKVLKMIYENRHPKPKGHR